jgi:hypothetical protein
MKSTLVARPDALYQMQRLIRRLFYMFALLALPAMAWAQPTMTKWDKDHPLPARLGPFALSSSRTLATGDNGGNAILHVTDTQGRKTDIKIEIAFDDVYASLGVGRIDPDSTNPQLLITSYTGGAHCCVHIQVLDFVDGRWRTADVGTFDGEPFSRFPTDIDGDKITDIQPWDDRFAYAFDCYACSWMPPRVFNIKGGKVQDVSAAPRYRALYVKDFEGAKKKCLEHSNAACAGMVADGYRLGRTDEAWSVAMANIDPNYGWLLPGCKVKATNGQCPESQEFHSGEFRAALKQFLIDAGIAPAVR